MFLSKWFAENTTKLTSLTGIRIDSVCLNTLCDQSYNFKTAHMLVYFKKSKILIKEHLIELSTSRPPGSLSLKTHAMDPSIQNTQNGRIWPREVLDNPLNEWFEFQNKILKLKSYQYNPQVLEQREEFLDAASERLSLNFTEEICMNQPEIFEKLVNSDFKESLHDLNLILSKFNSFCKKNELNNDQINAASEFLGGVKFQIEIFLILIMVECVSIL